MSIDIDKLYKNCQLERPAVDLRILEIRQAANEAMVECDLIMHDGTTPYDALSWCWGEPIQDETAKRMDIYYKGELFRFKVTPNLESALKQLRRHKVKRIWIDAICIHQADTEEKNNQVPMMASIYGDSDCVWVWLGDAKENDDSKIAFHFISKRVLNLADFDRLIKDEKTSEEWAALTTLMNREWFSRRWVVQEIALAKKAVVLVGENRVEWLDLADAISLFNAVETGTRSLSSVMRSKEEHRNMPDFFGHVPAYSATHLVEVTNNLFRRRTNAGQQEALLSLEHLVSTFTTFDSSQARDTIYALLAIAKDTTPQTWSPSLDSVVANYPPQTRQKLIRFLKTMSKKTKKQPYPVNYEQPISDVYVQFVKFSIAESDPSRALDIICRPWAPNPKEKQNLKRPGQHWRATFGVKESSIIDANDGMEDSNSNAETPRDTIPSWIRCTQGATYGRQTIATNVKMVRKNADTLVGIPPQRNYNAAGTRSINRRSLHFEKGITRHSCYSYLNNTRYHSMFVEGFILDTIVDIAPASQQGNIPKDWQDLAHGDSPITTSREESVLPEEYWRTLVADRGTNADNAPRYYSRLIRHALEQAVEGDAVNTQDIMHFGGCAVVGDVLRRVQSVIWNRKLIRTSRGSLGLAPDEATQGDLICILYGCSVPVLLRPFTKTGMEADSDATQQKDRPITEEQKEAGRKILARWRDKRGERQRSGGNHRGGKRKAAGSGGTPKKKHKHIGNSGSPELVQIKSTHRPAAPPLKDGMKFYQLIGECYVHGMMDGEAIALQSTDKTMERRIFEIR